MKTTPRKTPVARYRGHDILVSETNISRPRYFSVNEIKGVQRPTRYGWCSAFALIKNDIDDHLDKK